MIGSLDKLLHEPEAENKLDRLALGFLQVFHSIDHKLVALKRVASFSRLTVEILDPYIANNK